MYSLCQVSFGERAEPSVQSVFDLPLVQDGDRRLRRTAEDGRVHQVRTGSEWLYGGV